MPDEDPTQLLPLAQVANSRGLTKLIHEVSRGVGAVWHYFTIEGLTSREARAAREKLLSETSTKIEADRMLSIASHRQTALGEHFHSPSPLEERLREGRDFHELKRQLNIAGVTERAAHYLPPDDEISDEPVDPDWIARLFTTVQDVSTEELQEAWGKVLARETARPGSFSLLTLDVLRNMTRADVELFSKVARYVVSGRLIPSRGPLKPEAIRYEDLLILEDLRLLRVDGTSTMALVRPESSNMLQADFLLGRRRWIVVQTSAAKLSLHGHILTRAGRELLNMIDDVEPEPEYIEQLRAGMAEVFSPCDVALTELEPRGIPAK